jgi:hypothetical protein
MGRPTMAVSKHVWRIRKEEGRNFRSRVTVTAIPWYEVPLYPYAPVSRFHVLPLVDQHHPSSLPSPLTCCKSDSMHGTQRLTYF